MIADLKCEICLDNFDTQRICPRICICCGHTICEKCLIDIKYRTESLKCPYCKNVAKQIWPKNLTIVSLVQFDEKLNLCQKHKRPAISFCSSKGCLIPIAICDLTECAKLHKEKGTNSIPISLLGMNSSEVKQKQISFNIIDEFYSKAKQQIIGLIRDRKLNSKLFNIDDKITSSKLKSETNKILLKLVDKDTKSITSDDMADVKRDIIELEEGQELDFSSKNAELVKVQKRTLLEKLTNLIEKLQVDTLPKQLHQPIVEISQIKLQSPFDMIHRVIGAIFNPYLLFDSNVHTPLVFKSRIVGQPNLVFYIQLQDGIAFGAYFKRNMTKYFFQDRKMVDFDSFAFWVNQGSIYKASPNSISNYDMGPQHYFSVGNTNNWDGFWFKNNFKIINEDSSKMVIKSSQFQKLQIPLTTKNVKVFQTYQLDLL